MNRSPSGLPVHHQLPQFTQLMSTESVMPSSHLILCHPLLLLPPIPPSIRVERNWKHFAITYKQGCLKENSRTSLVTQCIRICCQCSWHVFDLWSGGFLLLWGNWAFVPQLLSLCFTAREPQLLSLYAATAEAHVPRAYALQQEKPLLIATRESLCAAMKT